jgi:NAD(P)-dependent dehydrogenase (short-subunit alcohol dehydrogenase family)
MVKADMGSEADIVRLFEETDRAFGPLTGLVNNAAINSTHRSIDEYSFDEIMSILAVNTAGLLVCCREAVKRMSIKHGGKGGAIVNISSIGAMTGSPGRFIHYAGSKGAVDSMTLGIATEVVRDGIRVNGIRPGMIDTPIHAKTGDANRVAEAGSTTPLGRAGRPEEVAEAIIWLLSEKASLVTGAILNVMGAQR